MNSKNPLAFPRPFSKDDTGDYPREVWQQAGMTLHDWFVGQATDADVKEFQYFRGTGDICKQPQYTRVEAKFLYADAMLAERAKEKT